VSGMRQLEASGVDRWSSPGYHSQS